LVARGQGSDRRRVVCRQRQRIGGGAALRAAPATGVCWRRLARNGALVLPAEEEVGFVPVIAAGGETVQSTPAPSRAGIVEIEVAGTTIRAAPGVDWRFLREVLRAVKAAM